MYNLVFQYTVLNRHKKQELRTIEGVTNVSYNNVSKQLIVKHFDGEKEVYNFIPLESIIDFILVEPEE